MGGEKDLFGGAQGGSLYVISNAGSDDDYHDGDNGWEDYAHFTNERLPSYSTHAKRKHHNEGKDVEHENGNQEGQECEH